MKPHPSEFYHPGLRTPLHIMMALHYAVCANDYGSRRAMVENYDAPAVQQTRFELRARHLIKEEFNPNPDYPMHYTHTPRLQAYLQLLLATPVPRHKSMWVDPRTDQEIVVP